MIYIFGYGSLLFPNGWNKRGMSHQYKWSDLVPTTISGYRRGVFAIWDSFRFYGICRDSQSKVNGILSPIYNPYDLAAFSQSENVGETYELVDISDQFTKKKVFTLVCEDSSKEDLPIYPGYLKFCWDGIQPWGKEFIENFLATGGHSVESLTT